MYCKNCGKQLKANNNFCEKCGTKHEKHNTQSKMKSTKRKNKKWLLIILIISILAFLIYGVIILVGLINKTFSRYNGELHEYEDFINYVESLDCDINDKEYSCNLKNKYEKVSDVTDFDKENQETRTITFKIKETDLIFSVNSSLHCTSGIDDGCFKYTYELSDNFKYAAFDYYITEYNEMINYDNRYCYQLKDNCINAAFNIKSYSDLEYVINYMNGFINYVNTLDFKFIDEYENFNINFEKTSKSGSYYSLYIDFDIVDNEYTYKFKNEYMPADGNIETYIKNYMNENKIVLE